jgi:hypothetical protein
LSVTLRRFASRYTICARLAVSTGCRRIFGKLSLRASTRKLVFVAGKIGGLDNRILALVEGENDNAIRRARRG